MHTPENEWTAFLEAATKRGPPEHVLAPLERLVRKHVGAKLFTVMLYDAATQQSRRVYTSHPKEYPVGGSKPLAVGPWSRTVIDKKHPFVANTIEAIALVFPDHPLILSLGCESVLNWPVVLDGEVIGTVNCLDVKGHYRPETVARFEAIAPYAAFAMLAAAVKA